MRLEKEKSERFESFERLKNKNAIEFEMLRHENAMKELEKKLEIAKAGGSIDDKRD